MKNICRILASLTFYVLAVLFSPTSSPAKSGEYLIGIFGIPEGNFDELQKAGVNSLLVRDFEIQQARGLNLKKIYVMGITPMAIKTGISDTKIDERIRLFKQAGDAYDYYLGDDLFCKHASIINTIKQRLGVKRGIAGVLKGLKCYPEEDILKYHYPLMRRQLTLSNMLKEQVRVANIMHSSNRKLYLCPQAHLQLWYLETVKLNNMNERAKLYPDGQVTRMLIYYALATDADGYFLYYSQWLSGKWSRERVLGAAQAILETKPLTRSLFNSTGAEFFQKTGGVFGIKIRGDSYDLLFLFNADYHSHYHPTISSIRMNLRDIINPNAYKQVYQYSPLGSFPVTAEVNIPQDHALILVACKDRTNVEPFQLDPAAKKLYAEILQARAEALAANLNLMGMSVPPLKIGSSTLTNRIETTLKYLDDLNELKRNDWLKRTAGRLPADGDAINQLYWKKMPIPTQKGQLFNFYYR